MTDEVPTDEVPKVASSLVRTDFFLPFVLLFDGSFMWLRHPNVGMLLIFLAPVACFFAIRALSTKLTPDGVSQLTWRGHVHVRWDAVEAVKRNANSIVVYGAAARVVIPYQKFYDSGATNRFIDSHLPRHLRGQRADRMEAPPHA